MTHITCRLTAKNRDQLRNTLGNRVWATFLPICIATCRLVVIKGRKGTRGVRWEASVIRHACHSAANISPSTVNTPVSRPTPGVFPSQDYDDRTTLGTSGHSQCQQIRLGPVRSTDVKNVSYVFILVTFF